MPTRSRAVLPLLGLSILVPLSFAWGPSGPPDARAGGGHATSQDPGPARGQEREGRGRRAEGGEETPLGQVMERMKGLVRGIDRALQAEDLEAALPLVADFQRQVLAAKGEVPSIAAGLEGMDRDELVAGYRVVMVQLLRATCDLEQALLEGRTGEARRVFEEELRAMQKPAHERFRVEDEGH